MVDVAGRIISKVAAREGAVIPLRLIEHGDVWRDAFLFDQPVQHRSRSVGGIPDKPLRPETKALLRPLDHCLCRADLGLANGAGSFDIKDDAELHVVRFASTQRNHACQLVSTDFCNKIGPSRKSDNVRFRAAVGDKRTSGCAYAQRRIL